MRRFLDHPLFGPIRQYYRSRSNRLITFLGVLAALAVIEILLQQKGFGQAVIILYGIAAVLFGIKSEESFRMAFITFGAMMLSAALGGNALAQSFAIYAFLLLFVGAICAAKELWRDSKLRNRLPRLGLPAKKREVFVSRRKRLKNY